MIKNKFCIVGIDNDFEEFIIENKGNYLGLISNYKKNYKITKRAGKEKITDWLKLKKKYNPNIFIVIDQGKERKSLTDKIYKKNVKNLIMSKTYIDKFVMKDLSTKKGILIQKLCFISSRVNINNGVKINVGSQIHHDVLIGEYVTIAPRALILGSVKIGKFTYIGANAIIKQGVSIGKNAVIGAGAVVIRNVKDNDVVAGNPAKSIK
tara:strand:+ start:160 stop:783 length:624 start_codon:yes stop_codon:yes gene_type:complete